MSGGATLPLGWVESNLAEITVSIGGGTPPKTDSTYWVNGKIPWVSPKDMKSFLVASSEDQITSSALERLSLIPKNSVLIVVRSGILSRTLPVAINDMPVTINQDMRAFVPENGFDSRFIAWQVVSKEHEVLSACSKDGTTVASIESQALARFPLLVAPAAEQTRIVAKLEELLSDLDAGVAELKAAQKKLAQYRQSLLKAAVEGALTAQWRAQNAPAETGAQLLERILAERRARWETQQLARFKEQGKTPPKDWQKKYPEPVKPETSGLPELPQGWVWATIDQLAQVGTGVTPLRSKPAYFEGGNIPWTTSGALNDELVTSAAEHVTQLALDECRLEIYPAGSLLVAMYGEGKTRGKCAELAFPSTINQAIAAIVFETAATTLRPHVKMVLLNAYEAMRKQASGGVQPNLNLQIIKVFLVPLPPPEEQTEIVATLETALTAVKEQQAAIDHGLRQSAAQRQNILRAAFSGQLVPQNPGDEPASALLERIRTERAAREPAKKARGRKIKEPA